MITKILIVSFYNYLSGIIFALQILSFFAFCVYFVNELAVMYKGASLMKLLRKGVFGLLLNYGIVRIKPVKKLEIKPTKKTLIKLKDQLQSKVLSKDSFETAEWLNALLFEIMCTSKSRRLIDTDQEALLAALTRISREAVESKLSDYQKDSWLFLSSLDLDSFSFGDRLPLIQNVRLAYSKTNANSLAIVMDISYAGGIKVGLKAAMAMNFRDFAASINFAPSKFKFILKMDAEPTPRISFMLSDLPAYEIAVTMKSQQMDRVSNLLKLIIGNFVRNRLCYPNYLTILFRSAVNQDLPFAQIANSKQYQSQLRVRLVSVNLNYSDGISNVILPTEEFNIMAVLSLGELSSKTEIINAELSNTRWNSIHTFNIFNGLETSPKCLQISLYQVIDNNGSLNHLGRVEIAYPSITPGILDIRTLPISTDPTSTVSLEMYLHHMEEDGEKDATWIFWNCPRPAKRRPEQDKAIEQVNWETIKFVISKLSTDEVEEMDSFDEVSEEDFITDSLKSSRESISYQDTENMFELIQKLLTKSINRLFKHDPLHTTIDILSALQLELDDFAKKFNLNRPALSSQALPAHNDRLSSILRPVIKSFVPEALNSLKSQNGNPIEKVRRDLNKMVDLISCKEVEITNESSPDLLNGQINLELKDDDSFKGFWGDRPVNIHVNQTGIKINMEDAPPGTSGIFDLEGIFYSPNENNLKSINLASVDLFNSSAITATWEVVLLRDRFLSFIPLGRPHLFPHRLIDVKDIAEIEIIKDRDAFSLGFNADLSSKESFHHANNGILRITLKDAEIIDLIGESRSCDQWYCILSCRLQFNATNFEEFPWKEINKIWLLPLNIPSLSCPFALAIRHESQTFVIINSEQIYSAYCRIKTIWLGKRQLLGFNLLRNPEQSTSNSSLTSSPQSQRSSLLSLKSLTSSSISSTTSTDPFASKTRFDRLKMTSVGSKTDPNGSILMMTSIEDLKLLRNPLKLISDDSAVFNCTLSNFPSGYISIGEEFICYWPQKYRNPSGLSTNTQNILVLPRAAILDISKTTPNWVSAFSGIVLKVKKQFYQSPEPLILSGFDNLQEMEIIFDNLIGIN